jgi:hypothetical protein
MTAFQMSMLNDTLKDVLGCYSTFFYKQFSYQVLFCFPSFSVFAAKDEEKTATDEEKTFPMFKYSGHNKPWPKLCSA